MKRLTLCVRLLCVHSPIVWSAFSGIGQHGERQSRWQALCQADSTDSISLSSEKNEKGRVNPFVRKTLRIIVERYDDTEKQCKEKDWDKLRRFLYRASASSTVLTESQIRKVLAFLESSFPNNASLQRSILQASPRILSRNVKTQLEPTSEFLRSLYGDELFLEAVHRNPDLYLTTGMGYKGDPLDIVEVYLRKDLLLSQATIDKLQKSSPTLFQTSMITILSVVHFLQDILNDEKIAKNSGEFASSLRTIRKLIESQPNIFQLSVEKNLKPRILYIQKRCKLNQADLAILIQNSSAGILGLSVEKNLKPTLDLLAGLTQQPEDLRRPMLSHPQILGLSIENLKAKIAYFDSIDAHSKMNGKARLASRILSRAPAVFSLSLRNNIIPTVEYLAQIWGIRMTFPTFESQNETPIHQSNNDTSDNLSLSTLLGEYPSILTFSLSANIKPTIHFYKRVGFIASNEINEDVAPVQGKELRIVRGRYIAASLYNRLLPRWHFFLLQRSNGAELFQQQNLPKIPLHVLAGATDEDFCQHMHFNIQEYTNFKKEAIPQLKLTWELEGWLNSTKRVEIFPDCKKQK